MQRTERWGWRAQARRLRRRAVLIASAALLMAGCVSMPTIPGFPTAPAAPNPAPAPAPPPTPGPGTVSTPAGDLRLPPGLRVSARYAALFAKGTVTGADLYDTLKTMRAELHARRSAIAWSKLALAADRTLTPQALTGGVDVGRIMQEVAMQAAIELMKNQANAVAMQTLDEYLQYLLNDRRAALAEETVTLPKIDGMTEAQAGRIVTIATLVVAARLSGKVLDKADEDFKSLATDYKALLVQREKAATLLFTTVDRRRAALKSGNAAEKAAVEGELKPSFAERDLQFIDSDLDRLSLRDFSNDMAAQNLAIQYLRQKDPSAFKDYRTKADDVVRRTSAYVRTVSGVAAFGGLTMTFGNAVSEFARENNLNNLVATMPLGLDFVKAAAPLAKKSVEVSLSGITVDDAWWRNPFRKAFTIVRGDKSQDVRSAGAVFSALQEAKVSEGFVGQLFSADTTWLNRMRLCDPQEVGRMLDLSVTKEERVTFARDYLQWKDPQLADVAFVNLLGEPGPTARERELGNVLLGRDHRASTSALPLAEVQRAVEKRFDKWNDAQLLRLVFANRETSAAHATLYFSGTAVRPIPSADAVYAYESRVEACRRSAAAN